MDGRNCIGPTAPAEEIMVGWRPWSVSTLPIAARIVHDSPRHSGAARWYRASMTRGMSASACLLGEAAAPLVPGIAELISAATTRAASSGRARTAQPTPAAVLASALTVSRRESAAEAEPDATEGLWGGRAKTAPRHA